MQKCGLVSMQDKVIKSEMIVRGAGGTFVDQCFQVDLLHAGRKSKVCWCNSFCATRHYFAALLLFLHLRLQPSSLRTLNSR